ncbi:MAG: cation:proton antiporter [Methanothrix sp.]|nr:monovalent cation:proton antiporter family protein [Methanothrix sp.]MCX8207291.1 cation:proton antiporter [Methanothrix sp.]
METELLRDVVIIFGLSSAVLFLFHRIKMPAILGYLITGVIAGPQCLGLIRSLDQVAVLAEIGVILLLFTVGIEISLKDMLQIKRFVLVGGLLQVLFTTLAVLFILINLGRPLGEAVALGFMISLSSTAIVLRIIQQRGEFDALHGRTILGILIFQDIIVVPMMLLIPMLPGAAVYTAESPLFIILKAMLLIAVVIAGAKWIVPQILYQVLKTRDHELFLLFTVGMCFAVAWLSSFAGLSLGLGAFLAGLVISESPYSLHAIGNIRPLRDAFSSFFFVSIGMLLDLRVLLENTAFIIALTICVILIKTVTSALATSLIGLPMRMVVLVSLALSQVGEFSFILSEVGLDSGIISPGVYQLLLDVTVLTMAATAFMIAISHRVAAGFSKLSRYDELDGISRQHALRDHLIIVGFGVNGRNVAMAARSKGIPYVVADLNPDIVRGEDVNGEPIYYGDATQESVLRHLGIRDARVIVIAISDPMATRQIVEMARRLNENIFIIARTRYVQEVEALHRLGADEVVPEEYETSVKIFAKVLERYQLPRNDIERFVEDVRAGDYSLFRSVCEEAYCDANLKPMGKVIYTIRVPEGSKAAGRALDELGIEGILAINRGDETLRPTGGLRLQEGDILIVIGPPEKMREVKRALTGTASGSER